MNVLKNIPELADRLKYIRAVKNLSQMQMAEIAGTTQQAIQQAETGKARNPRYLHKLALTLDIPYEWLTMNVMPEKKPEKTSGFSERKNEVLDSFYAMPKKDQTLLLELMKTRAKKEK